MQRKLKILYCLAYASQANGVVTFIKNYLNEIAGHIEATIVCGDNDLSDTFVSWCHSKGIQLHTLPNPYNNGKLTYIRGIKQFIKDHHDFDVIHCNIPNYGMYYLKAAKKYRIKVRIMHSHNPSVPHRFPINVIERIMERKGVKAANAFFASSEEAGKYLFGKSKPFKVIPNVVSYKSLSFNEQKRAKIRNSYGVSQTNKVFLFVGRLADQKNPQLALEIFKAYETNYHANDYLWFLGDGQLLNVLQEKANQLGIASRINYMGSIPDPSSFYSAADILIVPSKFEGLSIVTIEAQVASLPCLVSSAVPKEAIISNAIKMIDLSSNLTTWAISAKQLLDMPRNKIEITSNAYNASENAKRLLDTYVKLINQEITEDEQNGQY